MPFGCLAWDGGCHREMVDNWTIYELTIYELMMVYMFCAYAVARRPWSVMTTIEDFGRLPREPSPVCVSHI